MTSGKLNLVSGGPVIPHAARLWIDTDAACGVSPQTDPDDCFAIAWLNARGVRITGISTSFGNADGRMVEQTTKWLATVMVGPSLPRVPVWSGHGAPKASHDKTVPQAIEALQEALAAGPLTILALGPLTNIAAALQDRPDLQSNVSMLVVVMGHQPGHLFHPAEGKGVGSLFGHGPIFRDLNFAVDPAAAEQVLAMDLSLVLIPYDAASNVMIVNADLDQMAEHAGVFRQLSQLARPWLAFWQDDVGRPGFFPFDWLAAAYIAEPRLFDCVSVQAHVSTEWAFWLLPRKGILVNDGYAEAGATPAGHSVVYCPRVSSSLHDVLLKVVR